MVTASVPAWSLNAAEPPAEIQWREVQDGSKTYTLYGWNADVNGGRRTEDAAAWTAEAQTKNGRECTEPLPL